MRARLAPLGPNAVHLAIDMQVLFAQRTDWHTPMLAEILPNVLRLAKARPERTLYSRFTVPPHASAAKGRWRQYYERWSMFTGEAMDPGLVDLVPELAAIAAPGALYDKPTYSLFETPGFVRRLEDDGIDTIVFTGVETDVCVLATLLAAVDQGFRVIAVSDALGSSSPEAHRAVLDLVLPRMPDQIEIGDTADVLEAWGG